MPTLRKSLVKKLDKIFSEFIRKRDGACVVCGSRQGLQNGHLFSRGSYSTRWDELNCHAQCAGCNLRHEFDFYPFQNWFVKKFGQEVYDELYRKHKKIQKIKDAELMRLIEEYKEKLKNS